MLYTREENSEESAAGGSIHDGEAVAMFDRDFRGMR